MKKLFFIIMLAGLFACEKETMTTTVTLQTEGIGTYETGYYHAGQWTNGEVTGNWTYEISAYPGDTVRLYVVSNDHGVTLLIDGDGKSVAPGCYYEIERIVEK